MYELTLILGTDVNINKWLSMGHISIGFAWWRWRHNTRLICFIMEKKIFLPNSPNFWNYIHNLKSDLLEKQGMIFLCLKSVSPDMQLVYTQSQKEQMWEEETGEVKNIS